jgi:mRNA interferase RelE/StbE
MNTRFERSFLKDLKKINDKVIKNSIEKLIMDIKKIEKFNDLNNIKKIKGTRNAFRIRIGDFRIGIFYENNEIIFSRVMHRKDIYNFFPH